MNTRPDPWGDVRERVAPEIGTMAVYTLTEGDVSAINRMRTEGDRHCNQPGEGDELPFLICKVWSPEEDPPVNGQVFLDGDFTYWATSRHQGDRRTPGTYFVPKS